MMTSELPRSETEWVRAWGGAAIPVLRRTVEELERLREDEDRVVARDISRVVMHDPMFALRLLRLLQDRRREGRGAEITTIEHALMMLGVSPFFAQFADLPTVEDSLRDDAKALEGLRWVIQRSHFAARYAADWAGMRDDIESDEVMVAALMHDLAEVLLWCFAPAAALRIQSLLQADPALRSGAAQRSVLGCTLIELQLALVSEWKLPELLQSLMNDMHADHPRATNVMLAINLARHSAKGWDNPALPDDYAAIGRFLNLPEEEVIERIRRVTQQAAAGDRSWYGTDPGPAG